MRTKQNIINQAQAIGSTATTFRGALRYIYQDGRTIRLDRWEADLCTWGHHPHMVHGGWRGNERYDVSSDRGIAAVQDWHVAQYERRGRNRCTVLDLPDREESSAILTAIGLGLCKWHGLWTLDDAEFLTAEIDAALATTISYLYRTGSECYPSIQIGENAGYSHRESTRWDKYTSRQSYQRTEHHITVTVSRRAIAVLGGVDRLTVGGLLMIDADQVGIREYRASWLEQGKGYDLRRVYGHIIRGYHVERKPLLDDNDAQLARARKLAAQARRKSLSSVLATRQERRRQRAELASYANIWVGAQDSIEAGNCPQGTAQAEKKFRSAIHADGELGGIRADALLSLRDDTYVRRTIAVAMKRYIQEAA